MRSRTVARAGLLLGGMVAVSTLAHALVALDRPTPLYYPDEYIYSGLARSIAATGLPRIRGESIHFPALLGPYLMAPAWLVQNVDVAYRLALAWGSFWFSLAAIPAYVLARRFGVSSNGALLVALVTLLVPDAAFTTDLLSEPFAYPVFLTTVVVAIDAIAAPTRRRQLGVLALMLALCLLRVQFVVVPAAYLVTALVQSRLDVRAALRSQAIVVGALALATLGSVGIGLGRVAGVYAGITHLHAGPQSAVRWFGLDLFVLLIAAGWVTVPGAAAGLVAALRGVDARRRTFAILTLVVGIVLIAQAAFFGANEDRVHERYVFYLAPLLAIAFVWSVESLARGRTYIAVAYVAAAAAVVLPLASGVRGATDDESPSLLGLGTLTGGGDRGTLIWSAVLAVVAAANGLRLWRPRATPPLALGILAAVGAAGTISLLGFGNALGYQLSLSTDVPRLDAPANTALITLPTMNRFLLMKTLFWNANVTRVLVLGKGPAADGYAAANVRLVPGSGLVSAGGRSVRGPFAVDTDTTAAGIATAGDTGILEAVPAVMVFGWNRVDHYLETVSRLVAVAGTHAETIRFTLLSANGEKSVSIACEGSAPHIVRVTDRPQPVAISVPRLTERVCRISLVKGTPISFRQRTVGVQAFALQVERSIGRRS